MSKTKSNVPSGRMYTSTPERLASLETSLDVVRADVAGISDSLETFQDKASHQLYAMSETQAVQTHKLDFIEAQVEDVQSAVTDMEQKILQSVTNLVRVAKSTEQLDTDLAKAMKLFSKERLTGYVKVGGYIATICALIWGFIQFVGIGNIFNR